MGLHTVEMALELALQNPRVLWLGSPVEHSFPLSQGQYNSNDGWVEMLEEAGFLVDICPNVAIAIERLKGSAGRNWHVAAVCSGGQESTHLGFVSRFRRENSAMFLAVFDRDAAMSAESRTMLQGFPNAAEVTHPGRQVDMVTCWTDHLIVALKEVVAQQSHKQELREKLARLRSQVHEIFDKHDLDSSGYIETQEFYSFAHTVGGLVEPEPGSPREVTTSKIWDTINKIDSNHDGMVSWEEFWSFITQPDEVTRPDVNDVPKPHNEFGAYVLVVCQRADGSFLLVTRQSGWWLPGCQVDLDESPFDAAVRCCADQAGLSVRLEGVLRTEFDSRSSAPGSRLRMIFLARAINDYDVLKTVPNRHSSGAVWVDGNKLTVQNDHIPLAGNEPSVWFDYVLRLGPVYPLSVIASEGAPLVDQAPIAKAHVPFSNHNAPFYGEGCAIEIGGDLNSNLGVIYPNSP